MILYRLIATAARPLVWIVFRPLVQGRENLPKYGGCVLCPTHLSGFDTVATMYAMRSRPLRNMAKNQLFRRRFVGPFVRGMGAFPARQGDGLAGGVAEAVRLARSGNVVVIYPEGMRRRNGPRRLRTGAARVALEAGVPLVPVALRGTEDWRERRRWQIAFGPPIAVDGCAPREATAQLGRAIKRLEAILDGELRA